MGRFNILKSLSAADGFKERKEGFSRSPLVHHLTEEELVTLKALVFESFEDFDAVCRKHRIFYTVSGGTILGSIRHKGFIPWDDDIDIQMPRKDFNKLKKVFNEELGDKYTLCAPELGRGHGMAVCQMKRRGTILRSYNEVSKKDAGIPLDIFILETTYNSPVLRKLHGTACLMMGLLMSARKTCYDLQYLEPYFEGNESLKQSFEKKAALGKLVSFLTLDQMSRLTYRVYSMCRDDRSRYVTIPSGRKHFFGELYLRREMCRARKSEFEGRWIPIPYGYVTYLHALYGDSYMELPPEEDREQHPVMEISFGDVRVRTKEGL